MLNKNKENLTKFQRYLWYEIGIEFKACLYFFIIGFFYSIYRILNGSFEANIIIMAEMILTTYAFGYIQVFLLSNFDETDGITVQSVVYIILCSFGYTGISYLFHWFDRDIFVTLIFFLFMIFAYFCAYGVYKFRRDIDTKLLNADLLTFKERGNLNE